MKLTAVEIYRFSRRVTRIERSNFKQDYVVAWIVQRIAKKIRTISCDPKGIKLNYPQVNWACKYGLADDGRRIAEILILLTKLKNYFLEAILKKYNIDIPSYNMY